MVKKDIELIIYETKANDSYHYLPFVTLLVVFPRLQVKGSKLNK